MADEHAASPVALDPPAQQPAPAAERAPAWRNVLPFVLAIALIALVLSRLDLAAFARQLATLNYGLFLLACTLFTFALLTADTFATVIIYRRSVAKIRFRDFWVLRGASYLPSLINHHVGQAFVTYFLSREHGISLARVAGATLVAYASWAGAILGIGSIALALQGKPMFLVGVAAVGLAYLAVIAAKPRVFADRRLLAPLFEAGVVGHLVALAARLPHFFVLFLGTWLPFRFFGVDIPIETATTQVPILMVLVTLPLTPQGLGTRDAFAAAAFLPFAPGATPAEQLARLGAATMAWGVALTLVEAVFGLVMMRLAMPRLAKRTGVSMSAAPGA
jgi:hypothetical protein